MCKTVVFGGLYCIIRQYNDCIPYSSDNRQAKRFNTEYSVKYSVYQAVEIMNVSPYLCIISSALVQDIVNSWY